MRCFATAFVIPLQGSLTGVLAGLLAVPLAVASFFMLKKNPSSTRNVDNMYVNIDDVVTGVKKGAAAAAMIGATASTAAPALAYPIFAQQGFANPREATGRLVCANCHLAQKTTEIEVPQAVFPDQVFEAVAKVPNVRAPVVPNAGSLVAPVCALFSACPLLSVHTKSEQRKCWLPTRHFLLRDSFYRLQHNHPRFLFVQVSLVTAPRTAESLNDLNGTVVYKNGSPVEYLQKDGIPIAQTVVDIDMGNVAPNTVFKYTIKVPYDQSLKQV